MLNVYLIKLRKIEFLFIFYISCRRIFSPCQVIYVVMTCMLLSSCNAVKNNEYSEQEVGRSFAISFGTLLDTQEIKINGEGTIYGETGGALAGGVAGSLSDRGMVRLLELQQV